MSHGAGVYNTCTIYYIYCDIPLWISEEDATTGQLTLSYINKVVFQSMLFLTHTLHYKHFSCVCVCVCGGGGGGGLQEYVRVNSDGKTGIKKYENQFMNKNGNKKLSL